MISMFLQSLFWLLIVLLVYTWFVFPVLLHVAATMRRKQQPPDRTQPSISKCNTPPNVAIIISAWNEEQTIAERVQNLLALDYPHDHLRILIGTDGCTDRTVQRARQAAAGHPQQDRVEVLAFPEKRGKATVLKELVARAQSRAPEACDLIVFSDANTFFHPNTLTCLARHFTDASVGAVCGRLQFGRGENVAEHAYWNLETMMKTDEATLDSCLGANGAVYAIRPTLFWQDLPPETIIDDFMIGMKVREAGFAVRYDAQALATEELPAVADEWRRRVRIGSGAFQALAWCRACLHPRFRIFAWCFWSHKVLRWLTPHMIVLLSLLGGLLLWQPPGSPAALTTRTAQGVLLGLTLTLTLAETSFLWRHARPHPRHASTLAKLLLLIEHLVCMQAALLVGYIRFCRGNLRGAWQRTPRTPSDAQ